MRSIPLKINETLWIFMISQGSLGNLGMDLIHPPKLCAGLEKTVPDICAQFIKRLRLGRVKKCSLRFTEVR